MSRVLALVVFAVVTAALVVPFAREERRLPTAVPQPSPLFGADLLEVPAGAEACLRNITLGARTGAAELKVATYGRPAVPFTVTVAWPEAATIARQPATYEDNVVISLPVVRRPGRDVRGSACVRNEGSRRMALYAAGDRTRRTAVSTVDGRRERVAFQLALYERAPASLAARAPDVAERMATFRPVAPWVVWLLAGLVLLGVPLALAAALGRDEHDA